MGRIHFNHSMNYGVYCKDFHKTHNVLTRVHMDFSTEYYLNPSRNILWKLLTEKLAPAIEHEFS